MTMPRVSRRSAPLLKLALVVALGAFPLDNVRANPVGWVAGYVWHRTTDLLDILRCGVAVGPAVGAEIAVTDRVQLGAYAAAEGGLTFPHFLPPLWPLTALDDKPVFQVHDGAYRTTVLGARRRESSLRRSVRFPRAPYEARLQLAVGLAHGYASINFVEVGDFFAGLLGRDPMRDDAVPGADQ